MTGAAGANGTGTHTFPKIKMVAGQSKRLFGEVNASRFCALGVNFAE